MARRGSAGYSEMVGSLLLRRLLSFAMSNRDFSDLIVGLAKAVAKAMLVLQKFVFTNDGFTR